MTDYDTAVLAAVPDGYWKLDEASGLSLADSSGNAHPLVGTGAFIEGYALPGPNPSQIPVCADLVAAGTPAICATNSVGSYATGNSFTVEGWCAGVGAIGGIRHAILTKGLNSVEVKPWWSLMLDTNGTALFWFRNAAGTDYKVTSLGALNDATYAQHGPFHHIVGVFANSGLATLYVDGVKAGSLAVPNTGWGTGAQGLTLGQFNVDRSSLWTAAVAIYPTAFTDAGVKDHFDVGMKGNAFYVAQLSNQLALQQSTLDLIYAAVHKTYV